MNHRKFCLNGLDTLPLPFITCLLSIICVVFFAPGVFAQEIKFDIQEQPTNKTLLDLAETAGIQIAFSTQRASQSTSSAISGPIPIEQALEAALKGTGLNYKFASRDFVVVKDRDTFEVQNPLIQAAPIGRPTLLAQAQTSAQENQARNSSGTANDEGDDGSPVELGVITVTGSHIRGVDSIGVPSLIFTREDLDATGYSTVEEFFKSLPQNLDEISTEGKMADNTSRIASANAQNATSISLRGLGPGSTLVLLNGRRRPGNINGRVFDISAIPLSMVERIEVVTGGRSATYGSDAVAGVVNLVTRNAFDGAESMVYYGEASAGGERFNFSQVFGREYDNGGFVIGYDYRKDQLLDATEAGVASTVPSSFGITVAPGFFPIVIPSEQHIGMFSGQYRLSDKAELYGDAHFSSDKNENGSLLHFLGTFDLGGVQNGDSDQYGANAGVRWDVGKDWRIDVAASYGLVEVNLDFKNIFAPIGTTTTIFADGDTLASSDAEMTTYSAIADGPIGSIGHNVINAAIGVEYRDETFKDSRGPFPDGPLVPRNNLGRDVSSIFAEVHLPLTYGDGKSLDVSLAGRYDDYSDFGGTLNPQLGIEWEALSGLTFRGSYSEAFRVPPLIDLAIVNQVFVNIYDDPASPGSTVTQFTNFGGNPDLQPEEADTWTLGLDWQPSAQTIFSLSYFNIGYSGRIDEPADVYSLALQDEAAFGGLIIRNPTAAQLATVLARVPDPSRFVNNSGIPFDYLTDDPFATFSNIVIFDNRRNNIGLESMAGLDLQYSTEWERDSGYWSIGLNGTHYFEFERKVNVTAPTLSQLNQYGKTVDLKLRGNVGWSRSAWNMNAFVNYVTSYDDTVSSPPKTIDSWTTVDFTLQYDASMNTNSEVFDGVGITLGINNVFDEDPPLFEGNIRGLLYDSANSSGIGRFVSLRLAKRW